MSNDETIFVSDEKTNPPTVNCLERNSNFLYTLSICWFKQCFGIKVDENRNLLVCDWKSHKVFLITRDGKAVREFLTKKDGLYQPYTTSFRRSDGTLVVGCRDHNDILVFTLKEEISPAQEVFVLNRSASSEDSDETVHMHSLARAFTSRLHRV